jgi:phosphatidylserine decarboxylase
MSPNAAPPPEETPSLADRLLSAPQHLLPQRALSGLVNYLTRQSHPAWLKDAAIRAFVRLYGVNLEEAVEQRPEGYHDFNDFFTRALRDGARRVEPAGDVLVSPVDGTVSQAGRIYGEQILQAKGHYYSVQSFVGGDPSLATRFLDGHFATIYLSPRDYHRVHMPLPGTLRNMIHVPGRLFSVSPTTTRAIGGLFARNERVVSVFDSPAGCMLVALVGAINVSSMDTVWAGTVTPPYGQQVQRWAYPAAGEKGSVELGKGDEMGRFNMGSTVILLFSADSVELDQAELRPGAKLRMGQRIGALARPVAKPGPGEN